MRPGSPSALLLALVCVGGCARAVYVPNQRGDGPGPGGEVRPDAPVGGCLNGTALPVSAQNLIGPTCNEPAMLAEDQVGVGLDRLYDDGRGAFTVAGDEVASCAVADFGQAIQASAIWVRARGLSQGPCDHVADTGLDEGWSVHVLAGPGPLPGGLSLIPDPTGCGQTTTSWKVCQLALSPTLQVRYVAVCRRAYGAQRPDAEVDAVRLACQ